MTSATTLSDLQQQVLARTTAVEQAAPGERSGEAVDLIDELESLKNTVAAAQARLAVALKTARVEERAHLPAALRERGIGAEVALARRESPHRGGIHLGLAVVLCRELPHTLAAMQAGWCSEWRALQIAQGTACLSLADRRAIDAALMADRSTTEGWGERRFRAEVDRRAYAADPAAAVARHRKAVNERHPSLRPAADGMVRLSALLPLSEGVSVHATLSRAADSARAAGDERTRGQVMADTLVTRALSETTAEGTPVVPVVVQVTVSDGVLLNLPGAQGDQAGWVGAPGVGPVPLCADDVRDLVARAHAEGLASLRRLYVDPAGQLVAMDSQARTFPAGLAAFLEARDRTCRTPWCDAPVRHRDHVVPHADGGATSAVNGQGLCEGCNHVKESAAWSAVVTAALARQHEVETTTASGRRYRSRAPGLPPPTSPATWPVHRMRWSDFVLAT